MCSFSYWWLWKSSQLNHLQKIGTQNVIDADAIGNHQRDGQIVEIHHKQEFQMISILMFRFSIYQITILQVSLIEKFDELLNSHNTIVLVSPIEIQKNHLSNFNLHNLHKLIIVNCTLIQVDREAFAGLSILIELDLSVNQIKVIHPGTFHPLVKIRKIILHHMRSRQLVIKHLRIYSTWVL